MSNGINFPGPGTQSPWNTSPFSFAPNTNVLDKTSMPSDAAEAARQKSAAVMAALKRSDEAEANRLMGKSDKPQGQLVPPGPMGWMKRKLSRGKRGEAVSGKEYADSVASSDVDRESVVIGLEKKDGVGR